MPINDPQPSRIDTAIAEYLASLDAGQPLDREQFLARYSDLRCELADFLDNEMLVKHQLSPSSSGPFELDRTIDFSPSNSTAQAPNRATDSLPNLIGPYRLLQRLGEGGMGQVYEAIDETAQHVAIKFLNPQWAQSPESVERFKQEGALAATINHPRCVFVRSVGQVDGRLFIVMELMSGKTLRDLVTQSGPLPVGEAIAKILDVIEGLAEAHRRGVIHRDIKPANCFLEPDGRVKLGDFGLARSIQIDSDLTQSGSFIGTPLFASPEQIRGEPLDFRTDIYSTCATLYYLLTGQAPFGQYSSTQVIARIVTDDPAPIRRFNPSLPRLLEQILARGLSRDPQRRFQKLDDLREALEPFMRGRQAVAQLARRLAAHGFDTCLVSILSLVVAAIFQHNLFTISMDQPLIMLALHAMVWSYYLLFEGIWSATPGKMALHIAVSDSQTGEKPSFGRVCLRVAVYLLIGMELAALVALAMHTGQDNDDQFLSYTLLGLVGGAVLLIPIGFQKGSRLLHDILSGTMVVARHGIDKRIQLAPVSPMKLPGINSPTGWPERFGAFDVRGVIWQTTGSALLLAHDQALDRDVWLMVHDSKSKDKHHYGRQHNRTSRLRWLESGHSDGWSWDAFVAPDGAPLRYWVSPQLKFAWRESRSILNQIINEFHSSKAQRDPLPVLQLDQLWLDTQGRILLSDLPLDPASLPTVQAPLSTTGSRASLASQSTTAEPQSLSPAEARFALEAMRMCLTAKSLPLSSPVTAIEAPLPMHARVLLNELTQSCQETSPRLDIQRLKQQLDESSSRPSSITPTIRLWMLGVSAFSLLMILGVMTSLARIGNQVHLLRLSDAWIEISALKQIAGQEAWHQAWQAATSPSSDARLINGQAMLAQLSQAESEISRLIRQRWLNAGSIQQNILEGYISPSILEQPDALGFKLAASKNEVEIERGPQAYQGTHLSFEALKQRWQNLQNGTPLIGARQARLSYFFALLPLIGLVIWSTCLRGGLPFLLLGVHVVRADGRRASLLYMALRSLLVWLPMILVTSAVVSLDLYFPQYGALASLLHASMLGLLLLLAAMVLRWPDRGPHDRVLGTYLVPA